MKKAAKLASIVELEKQIDAQHKRALELIAQREKIQRQLGQIDSELSALAGGRISARRKRLSNEKSLKKIVIEILSANKSGFSMAELIERIEKTGYKSASHDFRNVLYQCLYNITGVKFDGAHNVYRLVRA